MLLLPIENAVAQPAINYASDGPNILIAGAPFQGERVTSVKTSLQDGTEMVHEEHEILGRDADGRFFDDSFQPTAAKPENYMVLADPTAGRVVFWHQGSQTAFSRPLQPSTHLQIALLALDVHAESTQFPKNKTTVTTVDLGVKKIAGVLCTGKRTITVLPAKTSGNSAPVQRSSEIWIANDLQIVIDERDTNPVTGIRTVTMASLELTAPSPDHFLIPHNLNVKDMVSMVPGLLAGLSMSHAEDPEYQKALNDIEKPETREKAADDLIAYAGTHKEVANHVAHVLAARDTHINDANVLARSSLDEIEQASSTIVLDRILVGDFARMNDLAEYWDTS